MLGSWPFIYVGIIAGMVDLAAHLSIECLKVPIGSVAGTCVKTTSPCRLVGGYPKCRCIFNLL